MSPTARVALLMALAAPAFLLLPAWAGMAMLLVIVGVMVVDAAVVRQPVRVDRRIAPILTRGVSASLTVTADAPRITIRQPAPPDFVIAPSEADERLDAVVLPLRRGRHSLPPVAIRRHGPLGLGNWTHSAGEAIDVLVYPNLPAARRLALALRRQRFLDAGYSSRGPLGLGTDFESIREYVEGDDVRAVNWRATERLGRPMSNQYRVEQDKDVLCVVDCGRLMTAPLGDGDRLDAALDAVTALCVVGDEVGDRTGALAFDSVIRKRVAPARKGARRVVAALFDLDAHHQDSDYELAFRSVGGGKRSLVVVFTDLLEQGAARPLLESIPVLSKRHEVIVVSALDDDLTAMIQREPATPSDVYETAVALDVLDARARVVAELHRSGARVVEAPAARLGSACVHAYLRAKFTARV